MKKLAMALILLLLPSICLAAGSWATWEKRDWYPIGIRIVILEWTADAADGSVPLYDTADASALNSFIEGWNLYMILTDPGSTAPTADYDITMPDQYGIDVTGATLTDRSATASQQVVPLLNGTDGIYGGRTIDDIGFIVTLTGNSENSATGKIILFFGK